MLLVYVSNTGLACMTCGNVWYYGNDQEIEFCPCCTPLLNEGFTKEEITEALLELENEK